MKAALKFHFEKGFCSEGPNPIKNNLLVCLIDKFSESMKLVVEAISVYI